MLRASARSIGSNYRRLWELSIIKSVTASSSSSSSRCDLRGGGEFLPSRNSHSQGSPDYNEKFTGWKLPHAQSHELKTSSGQQHNMRSIMDDQELGRIDFRSSGSCSSSDLVYQGLTTSSITSMVEGSSNITQRRPLLISCNCNDTPSRWSMTGGSFSSINKSVYPYQRWTLGQAVRQAASKAGLDMKSSEEGVGGGVEKDDKPAPRSIEDFQHEEIVGPTVERDLSETADEVRESLTALRTYMASFGTGFLILGTVQLVTAIWGSWMIKAAPIWLLRDLPFVIMSYTFAYLLWNAGSAMGFFAMMEGRSRLRILTLSLQVIKGLSQFFYRSGVMVKLVAFTSLLAMVTQAVPFTH